MCAVITGTSPKKASFQVTDGSPLGARTPNAFKESNTGKSWTSKEHKI